MVERNKNQTEKIAKLLERASLLGIELVIIPNVISEIVNVLSSIYDKSNKEIAELIRNLLDMPGIKYIESFSIEQILKIWPSKISDYGDAIIAGVSLKLGFPILTFDHKFSIELKNLKIEQILIK